MTTRARAPRRRTASETTILIISNDQDVVQLLVGLLPEWMSWVVCSTREAVLALLAGNRRLHGLVLHERRADGIDLELLDHWASRFATAPAVVTTRGRRSRRVVDTAFAKRARFVEMPFGAVEVEALTSDVQAARWSVPAAVANQFAGFVEERRFTTAQKELWAMHVRQVPRSRIAKELGVAKSTLRTREQQLCRKVGVPTLEKLYEEMMLTKLVDPLRRRVV